MKLLFTCSLATWQTYFKGSGQMVHDQTGKTIINYHEEFKQAQNE